MDGLYADNADNAVPADADALADNDSAIKTADLVELEKAVGRDIRHHKPDLVHVSREHQLVLSALSALFMYKNIAEIIDSDFVGTVLYFIYD